MKLLLVSCLLSASVIVHCLSGSKISLANSYGHDIIDGNCTNQTDADLVFSDHIHLHRIILFTRSGKSEWHGDEKIYCIEALNQKSNETGGVANVTEGGVGHSFVTIEMNSYVSHGIEFYIYVWAK